MRPSATITAPPVSQVGAVRKRALAILVGALERHRLMGRGIGYIDVHLLASAALSGEDWLWTLDRRLATVASELKLAAR